MPRPDCPADPMLLAFHRGELPDVELDAVTDHVAECPECDARLTAIERSTDALGGALREMKSSLVGKAVRAAADPTILPTRIGRYEVRERLARGGSGVVYRAWQPDLKRPVAVKVLRGGAAADPDDAARFRQEAEVLGRLRHPNLVQVIEAGEHDGSPFLVMEFVEGGSLDRLLRTRRLDPREAAGVVEALARAVHVAHQIGIVHRDIKPGNVLLAGDGTTVPKLSDFGLAKGSDSAPLTEAGVTAGTPNYMAPEQADAALGPLGPGADVYGLGGVLYECLTGRPPFAGRTAVRVVQDLLTKDPTDPVKVNPRAPRDLAVICMKCLRKRPGDRYPTAAALADDLARWRAGQPITARPVRPPERAALWARRNPGLAAALAGLFVALAAGAAVSGAFAVEATARAGDADRAADDAKANQEKAERATADTKVALDETAKARDATRDALRATETARDAARTAQAGSDRLAVELILAAAQEEAAAGMIDRALDRMIVALRKTPAGDAATRRLIRLNVAAWADRLPPLVRYERLSAKRPGFAFQGPGLDELAIWDAAEPVTFTPGPGEPAVTARLDVLDPVGTRAVVGGNEWVRVIDRASGRAVGPALLRIPAPSDQGYEGWRFGPVPDVVYWISSNRDSGATARAWDVRTGRPLGPEVTGWVHDEFRLLRARDGRLVFALLPHFDRNPLRFFDAVTGTELRKPPEMAVVSSADLTFDDRRIGLPTTDRYQWWDAATGAAIPPPGPTDAPTRWRMVRTSLPAGSTRLAVRGTDLRTRWIDLATQQPAGAAVYAGGAVVEIAGTADGALAALDERGGVLKAWGPPAAPTGTAGPAGPASDPGFATAAFGPGADLAVVGDVGDRDGRLVDAVRGRRVGPPLRGPCDYPAFTPDGRSVAAVSRSVSKRAPVVRVWDAATGAVAGSLTPTQYIHGMRFSPDGATLAVGVVAGAVLWDVPANRTRALRFPGPIDKFAFTPDGRRLVTASKPGWHGGRPGIQFWDVTPGAPVGEPIAVPMAASPFLFMAPNGSAVWTLFAEDYRLRTWDPATGDETAPARDLLPGDFAVRVAFRADGGRVAAASSNGVVRQWNVGTGAAVGRPMPGHGPIAALTYAPDGRLLATGYTDGTVRLWDADTGQPVGPPLRHRLPLLELAFTTDGRLLRVALADGDVETWPVPGEADDDPDRLARWVAVAAGGRYDGDQFVALGPEEWAAARAELNGWRPAPPPAAGRDRLAAVRDAARAGIAPARLWHLERLVRDDPYAWHGYALRAAARGEAGDGAGAAADRAEAARRGGAEYVNWCRHEVRDAIRLGRADEAIAAADRVLAVDGADPFAHLDRAEGLALADRPAAAAETLAAAPAAAPGRVQELLAHWAAGWRWAVVAAAADALACRQNASVPRVTYRTRQATALLAMKDRAGYRTMCEQLEADLGPNPPPGPAAAAARVASLSPDAVADWAVPLGWIDAALAVLDRQPDTPQVQAARTAWQTTRGSLLYRAGRDREAIDALIPVVEDQGGNPFAWAFLAMAQARSGRPLLAWVSSVRAADSNVTGDNVWLRADHLAVLAEVRAALGQP